MADKTDIRSTDAPPGNWVDRVAPVSWRPFLRLARLDRPIGYWLLLWPCWWSVALAAPSALRFEQVSAGIDRNGFPDAILLALFWLGAMAMRGAGCTFNDYVDRDLDRQVSRTRNRPLARGDVSPTAALLMLAALALVGLAVLASFNRFAILVGLASLPLVAVYPFAKRFTYWPQIFLGVTFGWGALLGWAAVTGALSWAPVLLYLAAIVWTLGYDTIYAHQDLSDDLPVGIKSTAVRFGDRTKLWLTAFYGMTVLFFAGAAYTAGVGPLFYSGLIAGAIHLTWQIYTLELHQPSDCLEKFRSNFYFGTIMFLAIIFGNVIR